MKYKLTKEVYKKDLDLVIPKGYRLIEDWELCKLLRTNEKLIKLAKDDWLWCNTINRVRAAGLYYYDGNFHVDGYGGLVNLGRSRGVLVEKVKE